MTRLRTRVLAALALTGVLTGGALATFSADTTVTQSIASGTLAPPNALASSHPSTTGGQVDLTWTPSTSPFVGGHEVDSAPAAGGPWTLRASLGPADGTFADTTAPYNGERFYRVRATKNAWTALSGVHSTHSLPMAAGLDRVSGSGAGTALTGPWTTAGTQLAALATADGVRYQPTAWPAGPTYVAGVAYVDTTHGWAAGMGTVSFFNGSSWVTQTTPTSAALESVAFPTITTGWAVGATGTIVATTNGGASWTAQTSGTTQTLWDVACASTSVCWAVGNSGTIRKTTNGGTTWTAQTSGTTQALWDLECVSATTCWTVGGGGVIRRTTNGGTTWTTQTSGTTNALQAVSCVDATNCWVGGAGGVLLRTTNGGATWTAATSGTTQPIWRLDMQSTTAGYLVGAGGTARKTVDGTTWNALTVPTATYYALSCFDASNCMIGSDEPAIRLTSDGGTRWFEGIPGYVELTPVTPTLPTGTVSNVTARLVYRATTVPGAGSRFTLSASADGGATWTAWTVPTPTASNTDTTASVDISSLGFNPVSRAQNIRLRFSVMPKGGGLTTQLDLAHIDVN